MGVDGPLPQGGTEPCPVQLPQQQGQPQPAEAMGAGAHQQVAGTPVAAADGPPAQVPQGGDGQQPLTAAAAIAPQQGAAKTRQGLIQPLVHAFHPGPGCQRRCHQPHREAHHAAAAHGRQVGEVGRRRPPAHIHGPHGGVAEVQALHQHIGVHHQLAPALFGQQGGVIVELARWGKGRQPAQQLPLPQVAQQHRFPGRLAVHGLRRGA